MELNKLEAYAKHGDMGPYSAQIAELIAIIRRQERELANMGGVGRGDARTVKESLQVGMGAVDLARPQYIGMSQAGTGERAHGYVSGWNDCVDALAAQSEEANP